MKRSALSLIGSLVGLVFLAYLCFVLLYVETPRTFTLEAAGFTLQIAVLLPCALLAGAAALLSWIGFAARKRGALLAAALLYLASLPFVTGLFAIPLALSLLALSDFFASLVRERKEKAAKALGEPAPEAEGLHSEKAELDEPNETEPIADGDFGDEPLDDDLNEDLESDPAGGPDDDLNIDSDDLRLEDLEDEADGEPPRPRADGMAVFLGVFMALSALALAFMVAYGVMGGKLPFMP